MKKANKETIFNIRSNKKIFMGLLVALLILSAGFLISSFSTEKASADGLTPIHHYSKNDNYSIYPVVGVDFSTDINNPSAVVSKTYSIALSETIYNELDDTSWGVRINHFALVWGRKDGMDYLYENTVDTSGKFGASGLYLQQYFPNYSDAGVANQQLFEADKLPKYANFPYYAKEIKQSDVFSVGSMRYLRVNVSWSEGNLYDIGIFVVYQYSAVGTFDTRTVAYYSDDSIVSTIRSRVQNASHYGENVAGAYEKALGIYRSGNVEVEYSYLRMQDEYHFNKFETVTSSISVPAYLVPDADWIRDRIYGLNGSSGLSGFNVDYVPTINGVLENGNYVKEEVFGRRTVRQATGFNYGYSFYNGQGGVNQIPDRVRNSEITYNPYVYRDFWVRIANIGDLEQIPDNYFKNNLYIDVYHTSYQEKNGRMYLYYDYQTIINLFESSLHWAIKDNAFRLDIRGNYDSSVVTVEETRNETNKVTGFAVSFPYSSETERAAQPCLQGLEVTGLASITAPIEVDCTVEYKVLNEDFSESPQSFNPDHKYWTAAGDSSKVTLADLSNELLAENGTWAEMIYGSIQPAAFDGIKYMRPSDVDVEINYHNKTAVLTVIYSYNSRILKITNDLNDDFWLVNLSESVAIYSLSSLGVAQYIPEGYRIGSIQSVDGFYFENKDLGNPLNTTFYKDGSTRNEPYSMTVHLTDKWPVTINYLEQWKNSPFAVMKEKNVDVRVADFSSDEDGNLVLSPENVASLLDNDVVLQFLQIAVKIDNVNIKYDDVNDKYVVDLTYTYLSMLVRDYSGTADEIKIALTPFSMWCDYYGKDWSIMFLNDTKHRFFDYSNDVAPDKLYGFFSYVVFKDEVNDFSNWIREYTSEGVSVVFSKSEVKGSDFYKFIQDTSGVITLAGGTIGLLYGHPLVGLAAGGLTYYGLSSIAEHFNEDNGTYYSYFFFLDGTTDMPWATDSGAKDREDSDNGAKNRVENFFDSVEDWFKSLLEKIKNSTVVKVIAIIGAVILGVIVLSLVIKLLMLIFRKRN